jgi:pyridoxine/pyridoxamine 5'-phosphate oxidase
MTTELPTLIGTKNILHRNTFEAGPRITKLEYYRTYECRISVVEYWHNDNGTLHHISCRPLIKGEVYC